MHHVLEVGVVDMGVDPKKALENCSDHFQKVGRKLGVEVLGEHTGVVHLQQARAGRVYNNCLTFLSDHRQRDVPHLFLHPFKEPVNVITGTDTDWSLDLDAISPQILVL